MLKVYNIANNHHTHRTKENLKMATNRKEIKKYLLSIIDFEGYDLDPQPQSDNERVLAAYKIACQEVGYIQEREGKQAMIEYWFSGLCAIVPLPYLYCDIIPLAKKWGSLPENPTEKQESKICENWFKYLACQFCQMIDKASR
jgi:hypothetical protein